jgi:hypothetical protein
LTPFICGKRIYLPLDDHRMPAANWPGFAAPRRARFGEITFLHSVNPLILGA